MSCLQWCGHCKHLVPVLSSLGKSIQSDPKLKNRVAIAKAGCPSTACLLGLPLLDGQGHVMSQWASQLCSASSSGSKNVACTSTVHNQRRVQHSTWLLNSCAPAPSRHKQLPHWWPWALQ